MPHLVVVGHKLHVHVYILSRRLSLLIYNDMQHKKGRGLITPKLILEGQAIMNVPLHSNPNFIHSKWRALDWRLEKHSATHYKILNYTRAQKVKDELCQAKSLNKRKMIKIKR